MKKFVLELPLPIGSVIYESDLPRSAQTVIGYRIGRMMGEDEEEFEEEYPEDGAQIQYAGHYGESSRPLSEWGKTLFATKEEAVEAYFRRTENGSLEE